MALAAPVQLYEPCPRCGGSHPSAEADLPATLVKKLDAEFERVLNEVYKERGKIADSSILKIIGSTFENQVFEGFSKNFLTVDFNTPDAGMLMRLTRDVWHFSAAKNYQHLRDLTLALKDDNGQTRSYNDFKITAADINAKYTEAWLKTEYNQAVGSATMAARWNEFMQNADDMPFLRYSTVGDGRVRDSHKSLDGVIRRYNDEFWSTHYPPNGWGCRCSVDQLAASSAKETENIPSVPIPDIFNTNLAKTGLIFPAGHPYYNDVPTSELNKAICYLPTDAAYKTVYKSAAGDNTVEMHLLHGEKEAVENIITGSILADNGYNVKLLPLIDDDKTRRRVYGTKNFYTGKNPDALINDKIFEFKECKNPTESSIHNALQRAKIQADNVVIRLADTIDDQSVFRFVKGKVKQCKNIQEVWVIKGANKPVIYNRAALGL